MTSSKTTAPWWKDKKSEVAEAVFAAVKYLDQAQGYRKQLLLTYVRLYGNAEYQGLSPHQYSRATLGVSGTSNRITLNIVKSMCDTAVAKYGQATPKPLFLTEGGDYSLQKKAKLLDKFVQGIFYQSDIYKIAPDILLDATVCGTGIARVYDDYKNIRIERVFPGEVFVDDVEAVYGKPRNIYQRKYVSREVLVEMYPGASKAISSSNTAEESTASGGRTSRTLSDQVEVIMAWHLPSGPEADDGRYVAVVEGGVLEDLPWDRAEAPFIFLRWGKSLRGFWGCGLAEELMGIQIEINKILRFDQLVFHTMGAPKVLVEAGSKIVSSHLNRDIGGIVTYSGMKPDIWAPSAQIPDTTRRLEMLINRAYEITGISQLQASAKKPAGLESAVAMRTFSDIASERHIMFGKQYEAFFLDAAKQMIRLGKELYDEEGEFTVTVQGRKFIEKIDWSEIDLDEDSYVMKVFPVSSLPNSPAGRLSMVEDMLKAGLIQDPKEGRELLNYPDLERSNDLEAAAREVVQDIVERALDKGEYEPPEPFFDLEYAKRYATMALHKARLEGVPDVHLELVRRFIQDVQSMIEQAQQPPANQDIEQPGMAAPGAPVPAPAA